MHRISGDTIHDKISDKEGTLAQMLKRGNPSREIVEELYLRTVSRYPTQREQSRAEVAVAKAGDARRGLEDLFWVSLNSKEFLYND